MRAMGSQRTALAVAMAIVISALTACTPSPDPSPDPTPTPEAPRIVTSTTPTLSGMEALMTATLVIDEDGCVFAKTLGGRSGLVWPDGYSVRRDAGSFDVVDAAGDVVASSGEDLAIGGGAAGPPDDGWGNVDCVVGSAWMIGEVAPA